MDKNFHYKNFDPEFEKKACIHLYDIINKDIGDIEICQHFTGMGIEYVWICKLCREKINKKSKVDLKIIDKNTSNYFFQFYEYVNGNPEILESDNIEVRFSFIKKDLSEIIDPIRYNLLDIQPCNQSPDYFLLIENVLLNRLTARQQHLELILLNLKSQEIIFRLILDDIGQIDLTKKVKIQISQENDLIAIYNKYGQFGSIFDRRNGNIIFNLDRGSYYTTYSEFPFQFIDKDDNALIIHGTEWNRVDITDLGKNQLLTDRINLAHGEDKYLDYFHGKLYISSDNQWIVDSGWVWHPSGVMKFWNVGDWLNNNIWASEDALTIEVSEDWDRSIVWIGNNKIAIWGYPHEFGYDNGVRLYNLNSQEFEGWFPGPLENLIFNKYLYSFNEYDGTKIWNVDTGELIIHLKDLVPDTYNEYTSEFIVNLQNFKFKIVTSEFLIQENPLN